MGVSAHNKQEFITESFEICYHVLQYDHLLVCDALPNIPLQMSV